jgi:CheY-like chemotaxis protein
MSDVDLSGQRVLVVEDEAVIAMLMEDLLDELGCVVVATVARPDQAIEVIETQAIDVAVLDVNLNGNNSYAIADTLIARDIPFLFATGYGDHGVKEDYQSHPILNKPFRINDLARNLSKVLQKAEKSVS